jgi:hypothetical protein
MRLGLGLGRDLTTRVDAKEREIVALQAAFGSDDGQAVNLLSAPRAGLMFGRNASRAVALALLHFRSAGSTHLLRLSF